MSGFFDRLGDAVRLIFSQAQPDPEPEVPEFKKAKPKPAPVEPLMPLDRKGSVDDFEAALSASLERHPDVAIGKVHLVSLNALKEQFGERWDDLADKALEIVTTCIKENLRGRDFFERHGECSFVIVLPNSREHEAAACLNRIRTAIGKRLIGDDDPGKLVSVKTAALKTDGHVAFEPTKSFDDLLDFVEKAPQSQLPPHMARILETLQQQDEKPILDQIRILYRPMWHVDRSKISSYLMLPCRELAKNQFATGRALLPNNPTATLVAELDTLLVEAAATELTRLQQKGDLMVITVPVHLETLSAANLRQAYLRIVEGLLGPNKRLVVFEVHELERGVPQSRLFDIVNYLTPHARAVCCRFRPGALLEDSLQGAGFFACGLDIKGRSGEHTAMKKLFDQFISRCRSLGLNSYLHGASDPSIAELAAESGFTFVDGEAVEGLTRHPEPIHRFTRRDLYQHPTSNQKEI